MATIEELREALTDLSDEDYRGNLLAERDLLASALDELAALRELGEPCEDCSATAGVRAFGTDHTLLCPGCYARAERNVAAAEQYSTGR